MWDEVVGVWFGTGCDKVYLSAANFPWEMSAFWDRT